LLLLAILAGLGAFIYGMSWLLRLSARVSFAQPSRRALLCTLSGALTLLAAHQIHRTDNSRSSFASVLGSTAYADSEAIAYSCPRSPDVPLSAPVAAAHANGTPVIVLMIESLRADLLTTYAQAMPTLVRLSHESMTFPRSYATSSHSDYEDLSFWYSRYPLRADHRLGYPADAPWRGISVFELFKQHGYSTAYFSSQNEKWGGMVNWLKIPAIDTYFDSENFTGETWENPDDHQGLISLIRSGYARSGKVEDSQTLKLAGDWIEQHSSEPFFIGLNLQNTHYNYFIPENGAHPYQPDKLGFRAIYSAWPRDQAPVVRNRYLNAAYNIDVAVARFIERLKRAGVWDRAAVLVIGDGGEAFYEHGFGNHSGPMYEEVGLTMAFLKLPKGDARNGTRYELPVSHVDFVPALADVAGMEPWPGFQGEAPWKQRKGGAPVYLSVNALVYENSVVSWPWKLMMRKFPNKSIELYDLATDPTEQHNVVSKNPSIALQMAGDLESFHTCQVGYYADRTAYARIQPPRYEVLKGSQTLSAAR
jgi:arylsulfatase A-like enzyme